LDQFEKPPPEKVVDRTSVAGSEKSEDRGDEKEKPSPERPAAEKDGGEKSVLERSLLEKPALEKPVGEKSPERLLSVLEKSVLEQHHLQKTTQTIQPKDAEKKTPEVTLQHFTSLEKDIRGVGPPVTPPPPPPSRQVTTPFCFLFVFLVGR